MGSGFSTHPDIDTTQKLQKLPVKNNTRKHDQTKNLDPDSKGIVGQNYADPLRTESDKTLHILADLGLAIQYCLKRRRGGGWRCNK
jgi:hypothetical protein